MGHRMKGSFETSKNKCFTVDKSLSVSIMGPGKNFFFYSFFSLGFDKLYKVIDVTDQFSYEDSIWFPIQIFHPFI